VRDQPAPHQVVEKALLDLGGIGGHGHNPRSSATVTANRFQWVLVLWTGRRAAA
jgi:hypothetical protein